MVRVPPFNDPPFLESCNTPRLHRAYDQLFGAGRWNPPDWPGTFPVRFPHHRKPIDADWHGPVAVDAGLPWPIRFWMGAWDFDALCAFVQGTLTIPGSSPE